MTPTPKVAVILPTVHDIHGTAYQQARCRPPVETAEGARDILILKFLGFKLPEDAIVEEAERQKDPPAFRGC